MTVAVWLVVAVLPLLERSDRSLAASGEDAPNPLLCARCGKTLTPGRGDFYVVEIEAKADPTPPVLEEADLTRDYKSEINALVAELENFAPRNQHLTIHLCMPCYAAWIEKPTG